MRRNAERARLTAQTKMTPTWMRRTGDATRGSIDEHGPWQWPDGYANALVTTGRVDEADKLPAPTNVSPPNEGTARARRLAGHRRGCQVPPDRRPVPGACGRRSRCHRTRTPSRRRCRCRPWVLPVEGSYDAVRKIGRPGTTPSRGRCTLCVHGIRAAGSVRV
ncbi:hypothetical protein GS421_07410 [Rhodococcus hoagii]|nr:hypothetical protein [Prescottella equi]